MSNQRFEWVSGKALLYIHKARPNYKRLNLTQIDFKTVKFYSTSARNKGWILVNDQIKM